jgi:tripartite-type tricarboxylate transporter receptor subunit TctC
MNRSQRPLMIDLRTVSCLIACAIAGAALAAPAVAQNYPTKPVRIVVPYAPGGSSDLVGRVVAQALQEGFGGQPFVVDNRPGAGGAIGIEAVVKAPPDGHTLAVSGNGAITVSAHLTPVNYDPLKDLAGVSMVTTVPIVICAHPSFPPASTAELIAYAKARPRGINYSSNGLGSVSYLAAELFQKTAGIEMVHIVYKGSAPGGAAVASGEVQLGFVDAAVAMTHARSGLVRLLAVTDPKRSALMPDVPTVAESGLPGFEVTAWIGMFAPAATPPDIIRRLNRELVQALARPQVRERILNAQMEPDPTTPEEMTRQVRAEFAKWGELIRERGVKAE